ncbi:amino acid ABC transporter [Marinobacter psychrophilus]|uniref:Amino acid ABC transporter n=1 Tax=Marinobacter psychrophilus TaxID=330734 RepID=A0A0H4IC33_9GAMM|nr:branched-chain amino acid ABC transporter permease [Marinobacter psychrophilus]AKO52617.1 amino acid ABC transporter [Marinobacter psychrophilus]
MLYLFLDIITTAAILFIVASGLLIIFGVMKIINFAHGVFLTIGGYASLVVTHFDWNPWFSMPLAFVAGCLFGAIIERTVLRFLYHRPLDAILATWGLGIVLGQLIIIGFGREVQFAAGPVSGAMELFGDFYSKYRLLLIIFSMLVAGAMWLLLKGTRIGLQTRAVIMNEPLARGLGINSSRVRLITFSFGAGLACLAGAFITPLSSVDPNMGLPWLVSAFMLVLVSGNSFLALASACIVLGGAQVLASTYISPVIGGLTLAVLAALLLRIRPKGFAYD